MKKYIFYSLVGASILFAACSKQNNKEVFDMDLLDGFPTSEVGYEYGVSGAYAGNLNNTIILAGGCNFPEKPVYDGGEKRYYKGIYQAKVINENSSFLEWTKIGELPNEAAYGVSVQDKDTLYFIGGNNNDGQLKFTLKLFLDTKNNQLCIDTLPSLPVGIDNMSGAMHNSTIIIAGGNTEKEFSKKLFKLNLNNLNEGWSIDDSCLESSLLQSISFSLNGSFYTSSGFYSGDETKVPFVSTKTYKVVNETDCFEYQNAIENDTLTFSGGCVVKIDEKSVYAMAGVNKKVFEAALNRIRFKDKTNIQAEKDSIDKLQNDYLRHDPNWYLFNSTLYKLDTTTTSWMAVAESKHLARAGAIAVPVPNGLYLLGGELKPGVRTSKTLRIIKK